MWIRPVSLPPYAHMGDLHLDRLSDSSNTFKEQCVELDVFQLRDKATRANFNNPLGSTWLDIRLTDRAHRSPASGVCDVSDHCSITCVRDTKITQSLMISSGNEKHLNIQDVWNDSDHIFFVTDPAWLWKTSQCLNVPADRCGPYKSTELESTKVFCYQTT